MRFEEDKNLLSTTEDLEKSERLQQEKRPEKEKSKAINYHKNFSLVATLATGLLHRSLGIRLE